MSLIKRISSSCVIITVVLLCNSCNQKDSAPVKTWFYNEEFEGRPFFEQLSGKVKRLSVSYSTSATGDYNIIDFDKRGNTAFSKMKLTNVALLQEKPDTTIQTTNAFYRISYKNNQVIGVTRYLSGRYNFCQHQDLSENYNDTVQLKYKTYRLIKSDTINFPDQHREADIYTYKYDSSKRITQRSLFEIYLDLPLYIKTYTYLNFDNNGNWRKMVLLTQYYPPLQRSTYRDTITRKITYY